MHAASSLKNSLPQYLIDPAWVVIEVRARASCMRRSRTWAEFFALIKDVFWKLISCQWRSIDCSRVRILSNYHSFTIKGIAREQLPEVLEELHYEHFNQKKCFSPSTHRDIPKWREVTRTPGMTFDMTIHEKFIREDNTSIAPTYRCFVLIKENKDGRIAPCLSVDGECNVYDFNHYPAGFPNQKEFDYPRAQLPVEIN